MQYQTLSVFFLALLLFSFLNSLFSYSINFRTTCVLVTLSPYLEWNDFKNNSKSNVFLSFLLWLEYCCYIWSSATTHYLEILDKIQRSVCNDSDLASRLQSLSHRRDVVSLCLFYKYFCGNCSDVLSSLVPRLHEFKRTTKLTTRSHRFTVEITRCSRMFYSNNFFSRTSSLWNSFLISSFLRPTFKNLNAMSIAICSFIFLSLHFFSLKFSHFLSLPVAPAVIVALPHCLRWNDFKNVNFELWTLTMSNKPTSL